MAAVYALLRPCPTARIATLEALDAPLLDLPKSMPALRRTRDRTGKPRPSYSRANWGSQPRRRQRHRMWRRPRNMGPAPRRHCCSLGSTCPSPVGVGTSTTRPAPRSSQQCGRQPSQPQSARQPHRPGARVARIPRTTTSASLPLLLLTSTPLPPWRGSGLSSCPSSGR